MFQILAEHWGFGKEQTAFYAAYFLTELAKITNIIHQHTRFIHHFIYIMSLV